MLSIGVMSSGQERYYTEELSRDDYYTKGGERPGKWIGVTEAVFALGVFVSAEQFTNLFRGLSPDGTTPLVQLQKWKDRERRPGWDFTFSAPKSVSTLWSMLGEEDRKLIEQAHFRAVRAAVKYLEEVAGVTRRGHGGVVTEKARLLGAEFFHETSRAQDAQIHSHVLLFNLGLRADGRFGAVRSLDLFEHKMAAGAAYRAELSHILNTELGLETEREKGRSWGFELKRVPKALRQLHSTRRKQIEDALDKGEIRNAREAAKACKTTRHVKEHVARDVLFPHWRSQGEELGWSTEKARALFGRSKAYAIDPERLAKQAISELEQSRSYFRERDVARLVFEKLEEFGAGSLRQGLAGTRAALDGQGICRFKDRDGRDIYTTQKLRDLECGILALCEARKGETRHVLKEDTLLSVLSHKQFATIREDQRNALEHLTLGTGGVACVTGMAGTGKTYMLNAARRTWEDSGLKVYGCALAATAAHELEDGSGIQSRTIAKTLMMLEPSASSVLIHEARQLSWAARGAKKRYDMDRMKLDSKSVLVVDEAGMIGTRDFIRLMGAAERAKAKIVFVGDKDQLPSIEAGVPFGAVIRAVGTAELTDITRQKKEWMRTAVRQFAEGDASGALSQYALNDCLHIETGIDEAKARLINAWDIGRTEDLKEIAILAGTRAETRELNALAQARRKERGELGKLSVFHDDTRFMSGDRIQFTDTRTSLGLTNGQFGTIERITPSALKKKTIITVKLDETVRKGLFIRNKRVTFTLGEYGAIELGYASTTHKFQGGTVDKSYVLAGGWMQDRELSYVQMSRARELTQVFTTQAHAGEDLTELTRAMAHSRAKEISVEKERSEAEHIRQQEERDRRDERRR